MDEDFDYLFKILLIGDSYVGKTSILLRYIDDNFSNEFQATIGVDFKVATKKINSKVIKLQLWDTAGQDRFKNIVSTYYRGAQGIFIVFDVTNRVSFTNVNKWYQETCNFLPESAIRIIVGNKCDLGSPFRVVSEQEGKDLANGLDVEYIETSAKNTINVVSAFDKMTASVLSKAYSNPALTAHPKLSAGKKLKKSRCC